MKRASSKYKHAMNEPFRDRGYIRVSIGIINRDAQKDAKLTSTDIYYNKNHTSLFEMNEPNFQYATFEENVFKTDGSMYFPPADATEQSLYGTGYISPGLKGSAIISLSEEFDFKGMTIKFGEYYPTKFTVTDQNGNVKTFENDSPEFVSEDVFTNISSLIITPINFVNGDNKRLRIEYFIFGVGLIFTNDTVKTSTYTDENSYVSESLPNITFTYTFFDINKKFLVDDETSFINYLNTEQEIEVEYGMTLDDNTIEWVKMPKTYLSSWSRDSLTVKITSNSRFTFLDDTYTPTNTVHTRTLYDDAIDILTQAGFEADEYDVDEYLKDITVVNPLPEDTFANCLQLVANAGRCILRQDSDGKIEIVANFANVLDPLTFEASTNTQADWSKINNVLKGSDYLYVDMTKDFTSVDDTMYFLPENGENYLETSFVSREVGNANGEFTVIPNLSLTLPAAFSYYSFKVLFSGNPPQQMRVQTYKYSKLVDDFLVSDLKLENDIDYAFLPFNVIKLSFPKSAPNDRVLLNKFTFGKLSGYTLREMDVLNNVGAVETHVKNLSVRVFSYTTDEETGEAQEVDDSVWYTKQVSNTGETMTWENQLISTQAHAQQVAEWLGNYYANNITYNVKYRGEPRLDSSDIIYMESDIVNNLQVEVNKAVLTFSGGFGGSLSLRRATNMLKRLEEY